MSYVTTLFIGGNKNATQSEFYTSFVEGINMNLEIVALAIVPGKIVTGICYPDQSTIKISNKFPHVTLMKGSWPPKYSNDLLEALCDKGCPLEAEWEKNGFATMSNEFVFKTEVKVGKEKVAAYVVKPLPNLVLPAVSKPWN